MESHPDNYLITQNRFEALDGARGVAAFGVVVFHCGFIKWFPWYWGAMDFFL